MCLFTKGSVCSLNDSNKWATDTAVCILSLKRGNRASLDSHGGWGSQWIQNPTDKYASTRHFLSLPPTPFWCHEGYHWGSVLVWLYCYGLSFLLLLNKKVTIKERSPRRLQHCFTPAGGEEMLECKLSPMVICTLYQVSHNPPSHLSSHYSNWPNGSTLISTLVPQKCKYS